jgi:hypothetical protein
MADRRRSRPPWRWTSGWRTSNSAWPVPDRLADPALVRASFGAVRSVVIPPLAQAESRNYSSCAIGQAASLSDCRSDSATAPDWVPSGGRRVASDNCRRRSTITLASCGDGFSWRMYLRSRSRIGSQALRNVLAWVKSTGFMNQRLEGEHHQRPLSCLPKLAPERNRMSDTSAIRPPRAVLTFRERKLWFGLISR